MATGAQRGRAEPGHTTTTNWIQAHATSDFLWRLQPLEKGRCSRLNPKINAKGPRRDRFHQHLSLGYGIEKLRRQVLAVETLIDVSDSISQFKRLFYKKLALRKARSWICWEIRPDPACSRAS